MTPFLVLVAPFPKNVTIKVNTNNGKIPLSYPFLALLTHFPVIAFINEEATRCVNEEPISAINETVIIASRNSPSCLFYFVFYGFNSTIN